jgi:hypothetical protein
MPLAQTVFLYNKANQYGLSQDIQLLEQAIKSLTGKVRMADPLEPPVLCDLAVHFEVPYYGWMPWARRNVFVINPEWWEPAWNSYLSKADALIFKCRQDCDEFCRRIRADGQAWYETYPNLKVFALPWTTPVNPKEFDKYPRSNDHSTGFLWLLGASQHKRAAAKAILPMWLSTFPPLTVYTTTPLDLSGGLPENITVKVQDLPQESRRQLQAYYPGHIIYSEAEALGLQAHEGQAAGAYLIGNNMYTYMEPFQASADVFLSCCTMEPYKGGYREIWTNTSSTQIQAGIDRFLSTELEGCRKRQAAAVIERQKAFSQAAAEAFQTILKRDGAAIKTLPPQVADPCPPISIITLLHNRRKFVDLAFHNLLITDYPKDKIEWVVIEDSDIPEEQASDKILKFAREAAPMSVSYIPLDKKNVPIGSLRNRAIKKAQHDIILFMDDDDHYPPTSFRRRVAWLTRHPWQPKAVCCSTIACYDLLKGTSAVNTPPWTLGLKGRVSEATLCFYKKWWEEKPFPTINMAEGEGFVEGREADVLELPPQQMIVAMSHGKNASSRRIPPGPSGEPSCFWGFPKEFLVFLHKLAGVEIEEVTGKGKSKPAAASRA